jgi:hypothetical protein
LWVGRKDGIARRVPSILPFTFGDWLDGPLSPVVRVKTSGIVTDKSTVGVEWLPSPLVVKGIPVLALHIIVFVP